LAERGGARSSGISITLSTHSPTFFDKDTGSVSKRLATSIAAVDQQHSTASLRGLEEAGAAAYFEGFADLLPDRLKFSGRNRRPPRDPVNAMLSLGYTLLHAEAVLALYGAGLDPFIGFYHGLDFGRESLACDLVEPLRVEVDQHALMLFRSEKLRPEDFSTTESGCLLGKAGRRASMPSGNRSPPACASCWRRALPTLPRRSSRRGRSMRPARERSMTKPSMQAPTRMNSPRQLTMASERAAMAFVIGYDISEPRRLLRVHREMCKHATPLEDDVRCYPLPARGFQGRIGTVRSSFLPVGGVWCSTGEELRVSGGKAGRGWLACYAIGVLNLAPPRSAALPFRARTPRCRAPAWRRSA
jgi:hypothetical protein